MCRAEVIQAAADLSNLRRERHGARAEATAETRLRILRAVLELVTEKMTLEIVLDDVASRADVSVQTIFRHFGSREGLFDAAVPFAIEQVEEERVTPAGDVDAALRAILDHYELRGDMVLTFLGQEHWDERVRRITDLGRRAHRTWVGNVFVPQLQTHAEQDREALTDLLVVAPTSTRGSCCGATGS